MLTLYVYILFFNKVWALLLTNSDYSFAPEILGYIQLLKSTLLL